MLRSDPCFIHFKSPIDTIELPADFNNPFDCEPHALCLLASQELQTYLEAHTWEHNFGLESDQKEQAIGKMFGVLVVKDVIGHIGYLAAFSGKIGDRNQYPGFVPPVFDGLQPGGFLDMGMKALDRINVEIRKMEEELTTDRISEIAELKKSRTKHSNTLQERIYEGYQFLNRDGEEKSLKEIFELTHHSNPPGGAGDCAAPRLLQYAFQRKMQPLSIAEFWWGRSTRAPHWKHKHFYPACTHKCQPILKHMLKGLTINQ